MVYYVLIPNGYDSVDGVSYTTMRLGESSFKSFWTDQGFDALKNVIKEHTDIVELVKIKDEKDKEYQIEEFLAIIGKLNVVV
jgi:hypothetical protein